MITPTVGRVVWFHPLKAPDDLAKFAQAHDGRPMAAIIANVWSDTCVNLAVIDPNGVMHQRTSVFLYQGDGDKPSCGYAEWMPYQKAVASGSIAPQLHAVAAKAEHVLHDAEADRLGLPHANVSGIGKPASAFVDFTGDRQ